MPDTTDTTDTSQTDPSTELKFSQADLDRIIAGRLQKYADYDQLKKDLASAQAATATAVEAAKTEARDELMSEVTDRLVRSEAKLLASTLNFRNPDDALRFITTEGLTLNADGDVDVDALKTRLQEAATERPYLLNEGTNTPPARDAGLGAGGNGKPPATAADAFAGLFN